MENDFAFRSEEDEDLLKSDGFINEIASMLQAFGDVAPALPQTITLIDGFVYAQVSLLLHQAENVAEQRRSSSIGIEEFMFLCRKNTCRLFHFMRHLQFRDGKHKLKSTASIRDETLMQKRNATLMKRTKLCLQFLDCINDPLLSDLEACFYNDKFNDIRIQRLEIAELVTRNMDMKQYSKFCASRHVSFSQNMKKFQNWLIPILDDLRFHPSKFGWESLAYFAYETVATLVHFVLLVKSEQFASNQGSRLNSIESMLLNSDTNAQFSTTPEHVHEALRRCSVLFKVPGSSCVDFLDCDAFLVGGTPRILALL